MISPITLSYSFLFRAEHTTTNHLKSKSTSKSTKTTSYGKPHLPIWCRCSRSESRCSRAKDLPTPACSTNAQSPASSGGVFCATRRNNAVPNSVPQTLQHSYQRLDAQI